MNIARALIRRAEVLLLDESLSHLDGKEFGTPVETGERIEKK